MNYSKTTIILLFVCILYPFSAAASLSFETGCGVLVKNPDNTTLEVLEIVTTPTPDESYTASELSGCIAELEEAGITVGTVLEPAQAEIESVLETLGSVVFFVLPVTNSTGMVGVDGVVEGGGYYYAYHAALATDAVTHTGEYDVVMDSDEPTSEDPESQQSSTSMMSRILTWIVDFIIFWR